MHRKLVSVAMLLCFSATALFAAQGGGQAKAALSHREILDKYIAAFNASDKEALTGFANDHLARVQRKEIPVDRMVQNELEMRQELSSVTVYKVEKDESGELSALVKSTGEFPQFFRFGWKFDPANAALILNREIRPSRTPPEALPPKASASEIARDVDAKLTRMTAEDRFSGTVLIAKDGAPLWQKAYGFADREKRIPNSLDTRFRLGSMNKMITAIGIAQLVEQGKVKYSDTIAQVLPDYPNKDVAAKVTVEQLLTHTSGLGDIFTPDFDKLKDTLRTHRDYLQIFANQPLRFEPGHGVSYSNAAFIVLGLMIEKLSGENYYDYVQKHIYTPAGMTGSGSFPKTDPVPNLAVGYTHMDGKKEWTPNWDTLPWRGTAAGGGDSNLHDLLALSQALRANKLIKAASREAMFRGQVEARGMPAKFGYGTEVQQIGGHTIVGKGGGAPGMNAILNIYLDGGYTVVALANIDPPVVEFIAQYIAERLPAAEAAAAGSH